MAAPLAASASPIRGIRLYNGGARVELPLRTFGWSLPRATLDDALLAAAREAGATVIRGRVEDVLAGEERAGVFVRMPDGSRERLDARILVGADGAHSIIAKICGLAAPQNASSRFALGGHYAGLRGLDGCVEMFVDGESYFAVNPFSESTANVMLIVREPELQRRRNDVDAFVAERAGALSGDSHGLAGARMQGKRVAVGPLEHRALRYTAQRVFLIGDAAHFLDPFTGQGVYMALFGARIAAREIAATIREGVTEERARLRFERELAREVRRRKAFASLAGSLVRMPRLAPFAGLFAPLLGAIAE
jgi:2-polyprenyl-6-methoxyphenol hydroxylase-like FAD-dependent oxidoreductase